MTAGYYDNWDYYPLSQGKQHSSSPLISSLSTSCYDSDVLWIPGGVILAQREEKEELWAKWMSRMSSWQLGVQAKDQLTFPQEEEKPQQPSLFWALTESR